MCIGLCVVECIMRFIVICNLANLLANHNNGNVYCVVYRQKVKDDIERDKRERAVKVRLFKCCFL